MTKKKPTVTCRCTECRWAIDLPVDQLAESGGGFVVLRDSGEYVHCPLCGSDDRKMTTDGTLPDYQDMIVRVLCECGQADTVDLSLYADDLSDRICIGCKKYGRLKIVNETAFWEAMYAQQGNAPKAKKPFEQTA